MFIDVLNSFLQVGSNQSMVGGAGVSIQIGQVIDLLGLGAGVAPQSIIGNVTTFGAPDAMGVPSERLELMVSVGTAFTTGTSATLEVALQGAADAGTPTYQPSTWNTFATSGAIAVGSLTANQIIFRVPWLPPFPANLRPRFLRLYGIIPAGTDFTAGTIAAAVSTIGRDDQFNQFAANNFVAN